MLTSCSESIEVYKCIFIHGVVWFFGPKLLAFDLIVLAGLHVPRDHLIPSLVFHWAIYNHESLTNAMKTMTYTTYTRGCKRCVLDCNICISCLVCVLVFSRVNSCCFCCCFLFPDIDLVDKYTMQHTHLNSTLRCV